MAKAKTRSSTVSHKPKARLLAALRAVQRALEALASSEWFADRFARLRSFPFPQPRIPPETLETLRRLQERQPPWVPSLQPSSDEEPQEQSPKHAGGRPPKLSDEDVAAARTELADTYLKKHPRAGRDEAIFYLLDWLKKERRVIVE